MNSKKKCKNCNIEFELKPNPINGKIDGQSNRQIYCSKNCKKNSNLKSSGIIKKCLYCKEKFITFPSQNKKFCSKQCKINSQIKNKTIKCLNCLLEFKVRDYSKQKTCSRKCLLEFKRTKTICITCGKIFYQQKSSTFKRCSRKCQFLDQSRGIIKVTTNGRTGYRTDIVNSPYLKSALEADFIRFLNFFSISFEYEKYTFSFNERFYTPDFYLPQIDVFVELKGPEKDSTKFSNLMRKNLSNFEELEKNGKNCLLITQSKFILALKNSELWDKIPNLEQRNYKKTQNLVVKHENKTNNS